MFFLKKLFAGSNEKEGAPAPAYTWCCFPDEVTGKVGMHLHERISSDSIGPNGDKHET